ncbi:hypothetical protein VTG60DRAFT_3332 [Thermothelomyces hinnuleus]
MAQTLHAQGRPGLRPHVSTSTPISSHYVVLGVWESGDIAIMALGDKAENGIYEAIPFKIFPASAKDRTIHWKPQNSFGRGMIQIGEEELKMEELMIEDKRPVPAGQSVTVGSMDVKFISGLDGC